MSRVHFGGCGTSVVLVETTGGFVACVNRDFEVVECDADCPEGFDDARVVEGGGGGPGGMGIILGTLDGTG